jgi:hypothetical protein
VLDTLLLAKLQGKVGQPPALSPPMLPGRIRSAVQRSLATRRTVAFQAEIDSEAALELAYRTTRHVIADRPRHGNHET